MESDREKINIEQENLELVADYQPKLFRSDIAFVYYVTQGLPVNFLSCLVEIKPSMSRSIT